MPQDAKITLGELSSAKSRSEQRRGTVKGGLTVGKHDKYLLKRANDTYIQ